jgi:NitT/TauT family transport system permease protein
MKSRPKWRKRLIAFISSKILIFILLALWQILPDIGVLRRAYLSTPVEVAGSIVSLAVNGQLQIHLWISLKRILSGLGIALAIGIPTGLFIGRIKWVEHLLDSILQLSRQVSALALFPVFILFLGIGETSKMAIIFWASLWPILINTISGAKNVEPIYIKSVLSMGANRKMVFTKVILPASVPAILTGIRLGCAYAVMVLVAAEMIGANSGLGFLVTNSQETFMIPQMYGAIVLLALLGIALNYILTRIERGLTGWREVGP